MQGALNLHPNTTLRIFGTASAETISGTEGAETFYGNEGADTVNGRGGNDTFYLENLEDEFDTINGGAGTDTVRTFGPNFWAVLNGFNAAASSIEAWFGDAKGNTGANVFDFRGLTTPSTFVVWGGGGNDTILAPAFSFSLAGEEGNDTLSGGSAADGFLGGPGADIMTGGADADVFYYVDVKESVKKKALRDTITDFTIKSDKIYLATIDANPGKAGDQAFKFAKKEGAPFTGKTGSLIFDQIDKAGKAKDVTLVYGDTNGDMKADMAIQLTGLVDLQKADLFL